MQQRRPAGLRVVLRRATGSLQISGTVAGERIRRRAQSSDPKLAREEARQLEAEILRTRWHGERRGIRKFAEAALSYLEAEPRSDNHKARITRLLRALGDVALGQVDQETAIVLKRRMLRPDATARTYVAEVVMPLRAILNHAHKLGWCDVPHFAVPKAEAGRTLYLLPAEAERLMAAAAPHLRPLLVFLLGTGARMSEAIELDWRDVDLVGARAIFWVTKNGKRRIARLPPAVVAALANLPHREGPVFLTGLGRSYSDRERRYGGQIKTAWRGAIRRAGLDPELRPHDLRHTWASWFYAVHRDVLKLKDEGGWSSLALVERYAHLLPAGHQAEIYGFWHATDTGAGVRALTA
jgi:integrase